MSVVVPLRKPGSGRVGVREALDQLELGGDLAALLGDLLLGTGIQVSLSILESRKGRVLRVELRCVGTILERDLDFVSRLPRWSALVCCETHVDRRHFESRYEGYVRG